MSFGKWTKLWTVPSSRTCRLVFGAAGQELINQSSYIAIIYINFSIISDLKMKFNCWFIGVLMGGSVRMDSKYQT